MSKHIPNLLTLANLFSGCCALVFLFAGEPVRAAWCTAACFLFDTLDGLLARALKINSDLGRELDSMADVVSFGVVPGAMLYRLLSENCFPGAAALPEVCPMALPAFVLSAFAGFRLAKFNLDTRQTGQFIGLTTPATTMFVLGLSLAASADRFGLGQWLHNQWFLYGVVALFSWLLVSEIPMFGMKIKALDWRSNRLNLLFVALFGAYFIFLKELAFSALIVTYVLVSIFFKPLQ